MYCPKCGTENPDDAQLCRSCSWVLKSTSAHIPGPEAKTSGLAITSLILGILSFITLFLTAIPAIIFGIVGLVKIEKSAGQLKGKGLAIAGIAVPAASLPIIALMMAIMMPALSKVKDIANQMVCETNMAGIGKGMMLYAGDNNDKYPAADRWCDLLLENSGASEKMFVCKGALHKGNQGRCSYAMNPNCQPNSPPDMVLLFETHPGWNQSGGFEILSTENHSGKGCNILFNDIHVEFIRTEDIEALRWTAERNP